MAFCLNNLAKEACSPTVKNTFISIGCSGLQDAPATTRSSSVPASARLCRNKEDTCAIVAHNDDASTEVQTDDSTDGIKTPMSLDDCVGEPLANTYWWAQETYTQETEAVYAQESYFLESYYQEVPPPPLAHDTPRHETSSERFRLKSNASVFTPKAVLDETNEHHTMLFMDVISCAKEAMQDSTHVAAVTITGDDSGWHLVIQPSGEDDGWQTERLLTVAKEALLDAAAQSKNIYLMGYCSPKPFITKPQGFKATYGIMDSPSTACWHVFKKGFCRHAGDCCKKHPLSEIPVHVLVEGVQLEASAHAVTDFKDEVTDLAMTVTASLRDSPYTERVEAFKDKDNQGWTVEVVVKGTVHDAQEYLAALAQNAMFSATNASKNVYIMGYAVKPFVEKSQGFVTILGDMADDTKACWDFYSKGLCSRDCACRWQHPKCLMPMNVTFKEGFSMQTLNARLECLVDNGWTN